MIGCAFCGDKACGIIAEKLQKIESIEIEEWTRLSQNGVDILINNIKSLKFLSVMCKQLNNNRVSIHGSRVLL